MDVVIDRGRWLRGAGDSSTLRNPLSCHECCVGTIARSAGMAVDKLESHSFIAGMNTGQVPRSLREFLPSEPGLTRADDPRESRRTQAGRRRWQKRKLVSDLMYSVNDDESLDDEARERLLTDLAASIGIRLAFTNAPLPRHATPPGKAGRAGQTAISRGHETPHEPAHVRLTTSIVGSDGQWTPLETATLTLDSDEATTEAYVYDLIRAHAHEHAQPVRVTAVDTGSGRSVCDRYHEPVASG